MPGMRRYRAWLNRGDPIQQAARGLLTVAAVMTCLTLTGALIGALR